MCMEIDLAEPLKRGFWIRDDDNKSMITVFYEKLLVFCFKCGLVGHGEGFHALSALIYEEAGDGRMVVDHQHGQQAMQLDIGVEAKKDEPISSDIPKEAMVADQEQNSTSSISVVGDPSPLGMRVTREPGPRLRNSTRVRGDMWQDSVSYGQQVSYNDNPRQPHGVQRSMHGGYASPHRDVALAHLDERNPTVHSARNCERVLDLSEGPIRDEREPTLSNDGGLELILMPPTVQLLSDGDTK